MGWGDHWLGRPMFFCLQIVQPAPALGSDQVLLVVRELFAKRDRRSVRAVTQATGMAVAEHDILLDFDNDTL